MVHCRKQLEGEVAIGEKHNQNHVETRFYFEHKRPAKLELKKKKERRTFLFSHNFLRGNLDVFSLNRFASSVHSKIQSFLSNLDPDFF
jgi:hypothetical protein